MNSILLENTTDMASGGSKRPFGPDGINKMHDLVRWQNNFRAKMEKLDGEILMSFLRVSNTDIPYNDRTYDIVKMMSSVIPDPNFEEVAPGVEPSRLSIMKQLHCRRSVAAFFAHLEDEMPWKYRSTITVKQETSRRAEDVHRVWNAIPKAFTLTHGEHQNLEFGNILKPLSKTSYENLREQQMRCRIAYLSLTHHGDRLQLRLMVAHLIMGYRRPSIPYYYVTSYLQ